MEEFKSFMLPNIKEAQEEIITFKGVETFKDKEGNPIPLQFKKIPKREVDKIRKEFTTKTPAIGKDGKYIIQGGNIVNDVEVDYDGFSDALIAKSMVSPDLKNKALYEYYNVWSKTELLNVLFKGEDYAYVDRCVAQACGMAPIDEEKVIKDLKN